MGRSKPTVNQFGKTLAVPYKVVHTSISQCGISFLVYFLLINENVCPNNTDKNFHGDFIQNSQKLEIIQMPIRDCIRLGCSHIKNSFHQQKKMNYCYRP